jgi:hypothetical protein
VDVKNINFLGDIILILLEDFCQEDSLIAKFIFSNVNVPVPAWKPKKNNKSKMHQHHKHGHHVPIQ